MTGLLQYYGGFAGLPWPPGTLAVAACGHPAGRLLFIEIADEINNSSCSLIARGSMAGKCEGACAVSQENRTERVVTILDSLKSLGEAADLVHPQLAAHHNLTGFIAASLAAEMRRPLKDQEILLCAGLVHDIGAFSVKQRLDVARFDAEEVFPHCIAGHALLNDFPSLSPLADIVRHHHIRWDHGYGHELRRDGALRDGNILHLADRVAVGLIGKKGSPLETGKQIVSQIRSQSGKMFDPDLVEVFRCLGEREGFWFDVTSISDDTVPRYWRSGMGSLGIMPLDEMAGFFSRVIDFRSPFTATHSTSVAAVAESLGCIVGLPEEQNRWLNVAGHLHDLGKMSIPVEILEKPGPLTEQEFDVVKIHPYHTDKILRKMPELDQIRQWSRSHHECLDGSGYPFHLTDNEICLPSRVLAAADIFVALTEHRPYRPGMPIGHVTRILGELARDTKLDARVVSLATRYSEDVHECMLAARRPELQDYEAFLDSSFFPAFR
jgi:HD-GYP domain-containing protein (c-di-GMP phosphodiesterase class II)